jgi:hypothetical protein
MLLHHCSNLEKLELGGRGTSLFTRLFDVRPLALGHWPKLRSLTLGHTLMREGPTASTNTFETFISSHLNLKELSLPCSTRYPKLNLAGSGVAIESFSGSLPYLLGIILSCNLTKLSLCTEEHAAWYIPYVRQALRLCPSLIDLELWINLSNRGVPNMIADGIDNDLKTQETDHIKIFRSILASCPGLLHFKVLCSTRKKYGFHMVNSRCVFLRHSLTYHDSKTSRRLW